MYLPRGAAARRFLLAAALAVTGVSVTASAASASAARPTLSTPTSSYPVMWYIGGSPGHHQLLYAGSSSACADDPGGTQAPVQLETWSCNGGANQAWNIHVIGYQDGYRVATVVNDASHLCLDDYRGSPYPGNPIIQWPCTGAANQLWVFVPFNGSSVWEIVNGYTRMCLIANGYGNGAPLIQASC